MIGGYNVSCCVNDGGDSVVIRFPMNGRIHERWMEEKLANEASFMEYIRDKTNIPVPRIIYRDTANESPGELGPFLLMDSTNGVNLDAVLSGESEADIDQDTVLDPDIKSNKLDLIYNQLAGFHLDLYNLELPYAGAISRGPVSGEWIVSRRPLTSNMNQVVSLAGFPEDKIPQEPFKTSCEYFRANAEHLTQLYTHRNLAYNKEARSQFISRHSFMQMIAIHSVETNEASSLRPFCEDMKPGNMLIDKESLRITAVLNWEFTKALPAQLLYDPPLWLLLRAPHRWFVDGEKEQFLKLFQPRVEQFIRAMERAEAVLSAEPKSKPRLSVHMRESWKGGCFWFNYMSRNGFALDIVYNTMAGTDWEILDEKTREQMESFVEQKMEQLTQYFEDEDKDPRIKKISVW